MCSLIVCIIALVNSFAVCWNWSSVTMGSVMDRGVRKALSVLLKFLDGLMSVFGICSLSEVSMGTWSVHGPCLEGSVKQWTMALVVVSVQNTLSGWVQLLDVRASSLGVSLGSAMTIPWSAISSKRGSA